jgi:hypothetical protein
MFQRMIRRMILVVLAAVGVQHLRTIARVVVREIRPRSGADLEAAAARAHAARQTAMNRKQQRLVISTLEPHGAI